MGELIALAERRSAVLERRSARDERRHSTDELIGATLRWHGYRGWNTSLVHGECELCQTPFADDGSRGTLLAGYSVVSGGPANRDDFVWICGLCYEEWSEWYRWTVEPEVRPHLVKRDLDGQPM